MVSYLNAEAINSNGRNLLLPREISQSKTIAGLLIKGSDATLVQSRVCLTAPIFTSACACGDQSADQDALPGHDTHTDDLAGSFGLSCVRGANLEKTLGEDSPLATSMPANQRPRCSLRIIGMLWTGRSCRRRQCWLIAQARTCHTSRKCTKVASEPI